MVFNGFVAYFGIVASVWFVFGVLIAAARYEGYSHSKQFLSELGATGSPTERFSPLVNNYPLGILFSLFGGYLIQLGNASILFFLGWLIVLHGVGTVVAGYFPMDADPYTEKPTFFCKLHSWAGFIMMLSLLVAPTLSLFSDAFSTGFKIFTLVCLVSSVFFTFTLGIAFKNRNNPGIHQRLSYGAQLVWLSGLSIVVAQ